MDLILFLSSGLFLGWSLGANDAANVFGTAVGTRMVRFKTAALVCSVFIVLGATFGGAGTTHTLGRLGAVNALAGAFTVALAAALATFWMTRLGLPVSTSQSIVGGIIGWNLYAGMETDGSSLTRIVTTWVACPLISAVIAILLYLAVRRLLTAAKPHLLRLDAMTRLGLLTVGAFGSYSLGANNIANVMGVFVPDNPFLDRDILGLFTITGLQQLFFLGALAIGVGVFTYSERVMGTVGGGLARISPLPALIIVMAQSVTLFVFASTGLESFLAGLGLPTIPLVPVSSSQAVIGAVVGLSLFRGGGVRVRVLGEIGLGWVTTPVLAGVIAFVLLAVMDNVFDQRVYRAEGYRIDPAVLVELELSGVSDPGLESLRTRHFKNPSLLRDELERLTSLSGEERDQVVDKSRLGNWNISAEVMARELDRQWIRGDQLAALRSLEGRSFEHFWQLEKALAHASPAWRPRPPARANKAWNADVASKLAYVSRLFRVDNP
jgi:PiT family inorganic phosphate transporter